MQSRALTYVTMLSGDRLHGGVRSAGDDGGMGVLLLLTLTAWSTIRYPRVSLKRYVDLFSPHAFSRVWVAYAYVTYVHCRLVGCTRYARYVRTYGTR